ncbi:flagellar biosynthesis regulator FlaF [Asaia lannensis]|nr:MULTISPECIES: flagellar biosynthesis regulator FlaF [Asaia]MCO6159994.1 flagellar biosynthesis regulator FlaF [Asaia lannensis NBRC 102526]MDL2170553.1 flagellar biosynthesis regulator FlaF [Asaia sp. HumB]GBQ99243.1 hypothetical protein AA102526_1736 [Asaia lannensis NBRC 102526]
MNAMHPGLRAYKAVAETSLSGREAEVVAFTMMLEELQNAEADASLRAKALDRHQKLWSLIMKANIIDSGHTPDDERALIVNLADKAQKYGIQAILNEELTLFPLIDISRDVLDGLTGVTG